MEFDSFTLRPAWLRPLTWAVRGVAVIVIGVSAYYWFAPPSPIVAAEAADAGLRAEISVPLAGGRRLAFYVGPAIGADDSGARPREPIITGHAATAGPTVAPAERASARAPEPARTRMCMLGDGVVAQASFSAGSNGTISAYGLDDVTAIAAGNRDTVANDTLPLLRRVREQGALAGLQVAAAAPAAHARPLPNILAGADGESAGDYALAAAHGAIDFLIVGSGDYAGELNPWYHSLNAGMRTQLIGAMSCNEIAGDDAVASRGAGLTRPASLMRQQFSEHVTYVSDGRSRLIDFAVGEHHPGPEYGREVYLTQPGIVSVHLSLAADLPVAPANAGPRSGWNIENARHGNTRSVSVEVVVNGKVVASQLVPADGVVRTVAMDVPISRSAWVAIRLPGAGHSNPVYVLVDERPVRASRASVEWNIQALTRAYEAGSASWSAARAPLANAAYEYAFAVYNHILQETSEP